MNSVKLTLFIAGLAMTVNCVAENPTDTQCTNASVRAGLPSPTVRGAEKPRIESHWKGKKVAFLGDSISDPRNLGRRKFYWEYLAFTLGVDAHVYARSGARMDRMLTYAKDVKKDLDGHADALFVFAGTNDYNGGVPLGKWYDEAEEETVRNGEKVRLVRRSFSMDENTFRGRINRLMDYLRRNFPEQQIVMMTALHRGYAKFSDRNVQPDESFPNALGLHIDDYNQAIREAGRIWSVPVLDLHERCGLFPLFSEHSCYFMDVNKDMLHPNDAGHARIAETMARWMLALPSDFKGCGAVSR
jgi:lysophospholipase L1-like esterase